MKSTERAFHWIIDLLERHKITYRISGGLAARVYGSKRELADIDIEVADEDILKIAREVGSRITFGPANYKDDHWDLELMTLVYEGQEIDIAGSGAKIFNKVTALWEPCSGDSRDVEIMEIFGRDVPVEPRKHLIAYKSKLLREVDIEDIKQLGTLEKDSD